MPCIILCIAALFSAMNDDDWLVAVPCGNRKADDVAAMIVAAAITIDTPLGRRHHVRESCMRSVH
jgi:hypothetical protein